MGFGCPAAVAGVAGLGAGYGFQVAVSIDAADQVIECVGEIDHAIGRQRQALGGPEKGCRGRSAVFGESFFAAAGYGGDDAIRVDPAHHVLATVGKVDRAVFSNADGGGAADPGGGGRAPITVEAGKADAGDRGYDATDRVDAADAADAVSKEQVTGRVVGDGRDVHQARSDRGAAVTLVPGEVGAGDAVDGAVRLDAADVAVTMVGDDDPALRIYRHVVGIAQIGAGGGAIVAAVGAGAVAGDGVDQAVGVDLADALVSAIGEVDLAIGSHRQPVRAG